MASDCGRGFDPQRNEAVIRLGIGYVRYSLRGPEFHRTHVFADGDKYKFCHGLCVYDLGVCVSELSMDHCTLCVRDGRPQMAQFWCERRPRGSCLYLEFGQFVSRKGGRFYQFHGTGDAAVHWPCARKHWSWDFLKDPRPYERSS